MEGELLFIDPKNYLPATRFYLFTDSTVQATETVSDAEPSSRASSHVDISLQTLAIGDASGLANFNLLPVDAVIPALFGALTPK